MTSRFAFPWMGTNESTPRMAAVQPLDAIKGCFARDVDDERLGLRELFPLPRPRRPRRRRPRPRSRKSTPRETPKSPERSANRIPAGRLQLGEHRARPIAAAPTEHQAIRDRINGESQSIIADTASSSTPARTSCDALAQRACQMSSIRRIATAKQTCDATRARPPTPKQTISTIRFARIIGR